MKRSAFTLIEILVVVAIIAVLASITLMFLPSRQSQAAFTAADQLQTVLASVKNRALRDQSACGIRFISNDGYKTFDSYVIVADVGRLAPLDPNVDPNLINHVPGPASIYLVCPSGSKTVTQVGVQLSGQVDPGDILEIVEGSGSTNRIMSVDPIANTVTLANVPNVSITCDARLLWNYRYVRQPKPLMGETTKQLARSIVVMGATGIVPTSLNVPVSASGQFEILFSPSGQVVNATSRIVLWMEDQTGSSKSQLVTIQPYTGSITVNPVGASGQEFQFTYDGRSGQ